MRSVLDGCNRYLIHWEIREWMREIDMEKTPQPTHERFATAIPRAISDNGPAFVAHDLKAFLRQCGMPHVKTLPFCPHNIGKIERWHGTLKHEHIRIKHRDVQGTPDALWGSMCNSTMTSICMCGQRLRGQDEALSTQRRRMLTTEREATRSRQAWKLVKGAC